MFLVLPSPSPAPISIAGAGSWKTGVSVDRDITHIGPIVEALLDSVTVVSVEIDDQDILAQAPDDDLGGQCDRIEETVTLGRVAFGVVGGRPDHQKGAFDLDR